VTVRPTLLLRDGAAIPEALGDQRVTMDEIRQAVRASGSGDLSSIAALVRESDGSLGVIPSSTLGRGSSLAGVPGLDG
jgi:uncharacterized membrane protein YcaP (DUF421 family)